MATIYRKSAKGILEIDTRAHGLAPRQRHLLILVDGRRTQSELQALVPQATEGLAWLLEQGFIEVFASPGA